VARSAEDGNPRFHFFLFFSYPPLAAARVPEEKGRGGRGGKRNGTTAFCLRHSVLVSFSFLAGAGEKKKGGKERGKRGKKKVTATVAVTLEQ